MGEVGPDLQKCDLYTAHRKLYYHKAYLGKAEILLIWNQISAFERHPFPLVGLLCAALEGVFELLCVELEHGPVPANAVHLLSHQTFWAPQACMSVTDFMKVLSTSSQGDWQLGRAEGAFQACRWEGGGTPTEKNIYWVVSGCQHWCSCLDMPFIKNCRCKQATQTRTKQNLL